MSSVVNVARLWLLVSLAIARRIFKRLLLGPTLPSWTWRTDIAVAVARTAIGFAATVPDDPIITQFGLRIKAPVPAVLGRSVRVSSSNLGSRDADRYIRLGATTDSATILYFHGGGYVFGNPGTHRQHLARLVHATGTTAIAPRYRLAPKHKYPAALDDAVDAYRALIASGTDPAHVMVSGDSAGAGLALAMLLRLRDAGDVLPSGAILFSPYADLEHTAYTIATNAGTDYLPASELSAPKRYLRGTHPTQRSFRFSCSRRSDGTPTNAHLCRWRRNDSRRLGSPESQRRTRRCGRDAFRRTRNDARVASDRSMGARSSSLLGDSSGLDCHRPIAIDPRRMLPSIA